MTNPQPLQNAAECSRGRWQYSLRDMLVLTLSVSVVLALWRIFRGALGPMEILLLAVAGVSLVLSGIFAGRRWAWLVGTPFWGRPWFVGLAVCFLTTHYLTPASLLVKLIVNACACGVYLLAGLPVVIGAPVDHKRSPWVLGSIACFLVPALITPADPPSMLTVGAPLWLSLVVVAIVWRKWRSAIRVLGPLLVVGGMAAAVVGYVAVFRSVFLTSTTPKPSHVAMGLTWAGLLARSGVSTAVLGAFATLADFFHKRAP